MLSVAEECGGLVERHRDKLVDRSRIPFDDAAFGSRIARRLGWRPPPDVARLKALRR